MTFFRTIAVAFGMFSRIPMPRVAWDEKNMRYMLCAFPLVGAVIGFILWLWGRLCQIFVWGDFFFAAGVTLLPVAVTGGVHLDGFCDTTDALASHADSEKRREILKDPHTGAFAVIALGCYLLLYCALTTELPKELLPLLGGMHILSRVLSGLAVLSFPGAEKKGLVSVFRSSAAGKRAVFGLLMEFAAVVAAMIFLFWPHGAAMVFVSLACFLLLRVTARRSFGGMSGDLAGWFLQTAELIMVLALILTESVVRL